MASSSGSDPGPVELDLRGERCPMTFVRARLALEDLPLGGSLRVRVDFEPATRNLPKSAREWGQHVAPPIALGDGSWSIVITRRAK
jgi:TusA-related sulfurtransferase